MGEGGGGRHSCVPEILYRNILRHEIFRIFPQKYKRAADLSVDLSEFSSFFVLAVGSTPPPTCMRALPCSS